jgi:hypothetical protein
MAVKENGWPAENKLVRLCQVVTYSGGKRKRFDEPISNAMEDDEFEVPRMGERH